jgi:hypothetical protein
MRYRYWEYHVLHSHDIYDQVWRYPLVYNDSFQSDDKLQMKIYLNTFKIFEKNSFDTTLTKNVLDEIRKDTITLFNEDKTPDLKVHKRNQVHWLLWLSSTLCEPPQWYLTRTPFEIRVDFIKKWRLFKCWRSVRAREARSQDRTVEDWWG